MSLYFVPLMTDIGIMSPLSFIIRKLSFHCMTIEEMGQSYTILRLGKKMCFLKDVLGDACGTVSSTEQRTGLANILYAIRCADIH